MNKQTYKSMLFESLVDFGNMQTFKSPADKVLETVKKGNMDDFEPTRDACDEIAVLGRVYDARDNDRPIIREDDEEGDAQGDIDIDAKDIDLTAKEDDMSDFSGNDAGAMPNATKTDEFDDVIMDEGVFLGEDDEEMDDDEDTDDDDEDDEGIEEDDEEMDDDENIDEVEDDEDEQRGQAEDEYNGHDGYDGHIPQVSVKSEEILAVIFYLDAHPFFFYLCYGRFPLAFIRSDAQRVGHVLSVHYGVLQFNHPLLSVYGVGYDAVFRLKSQACHGHQAKKGK